MALGKDKTRILVNIPNDLKLEIEKSAKEENRSVSNYIVNLLEKHIKANSKQK